jgi:hypothetical protein
MSLLLELILCIGPIVIAAMVIIAFFSYHICGWRIHICALNLHAYAHTKDVKHIDMELIDSHNVCAKCSKERVRVYNMWGNKVNEYYLQKLTGEVKP